MFFDTVKLDEFLIAGVFVRTTNFNGQSQKDIGNLWARFAQEGIIQKIPAKLGDEIYCLYTDYENDADGFYTVIIGCRVSALGDLVEGLMGMKIPFCTYRLYSSIGKIPKVVVETWKNIWQSDIDRRFLADFDLYRINPADMNIGEVETYVSVK